MTTTEASNYLLIGLPEVGKTSFLAALWFMVNQSDIDCAFKLQQLDGDRSYLNLIRECWLEYKPVPRNLVDSEKQISMLLIERATDRVIRLDIPDLSGESFNLQWSHRQLTQEYDSFLPKATGAILFLHPNQISRPHRIDEMDGPVDEIVAKTGTLSGTSVAQLSQKKWEIEKSPTQIKLVDILQFISNRDYFRPPFRLSVIVSAWDLLQGKFTGDAGEWVANELPLMHQFLESSEEFMVHYYGLSAQGGRYATPLFWEESFADSEGLVTKLLDGRDPVSAWIWSQIEEPKRKKLTDPEKAERSRSRALAITLNEIITKPSMFNEERFRDVPLRAEVRELLAAQMLKSSDDLLRLNRMLLEDAFTNEIRKTWRFAAEEEALQAKKPSRRVLINGQGIGNPHDVTEPIRWLLVNG